MSTEAIPLVRSADRLTSDILRCVFTDAEMLELGKRMALASNQKRELEARKSEVTKRLSAEIAEKDAELGKLTERVSQGYEYRTVECGIWFDVPRPGIATTYRMDTFETVGERRMSDEELQRMLEFHEKESDAAEAANEAASEAE
jgi:hypothetical protein